MAGYTNEAASKLCWADVEVEEDDLPPALREQVSRLTEYKVAAPLVCDRSLCVGWLPSIEESDEDVHEDHHVKLSRQLSYHGSDSTDVPDDVSDEEESSSVAGYEVVIA